MDGPDAGQGHGLVPEALDVGGRAATEAELREWAPRLRDLAERAGRVHALMINCYQDYGVRDAADLAAILNG